MSAAPKLDVVLRHKILVVERDEIQARKLQYFLERFGHEALILADTSKVLPTLEDGEEISLVIAEFGGAEETGIALSKRVRSHPKFSRLPVMLLASQEEALGKSDAQLADVNDLLIKPFRPTELQVRLRNLIALSEYESFLSEENDKLGLELVEKNRELEANYAKLEKTYHELQELQSKLVQSAKMVSMGILSTGIAHEINNPLAIIMGFNSQLSSMLKAKKFDEEKVAKIHERITTSIGRIVRIVDSMKAIATPKKVDSKHQFEIDAMIPELTDFFGELASAKGIAVEFDLGCKGAWIKHADANEIRQAVLALVQNSIDAMEKSETKRLTIATAVKGAHAFIFVRDTGPGISDSIKEKVFDAFFTTKNPDRGTGLGLTLAYRIVQDNGGDLTFANTSDGCQFSIRLPLASLFSSTY